MLTAAPDIIDPEHLDEQPAIGARTDKPGYDRTGPVANRQDDPFVGGLFILRPQRRQKLALQ